MLTKDELYKGKAFWNALVNNHNWMNEQRVGNAKSRQDFIGAASGLAQMNIGNPFELIEKYQNEQIAAEQAKQAFAAVTPDKGPVVNGVVPQKSVTPTRVIKKGDRK